MTEDRAVVHEVWAGMLPVCFKLASHETVSLQPAAPYFMMVPRITYFPFVWEKVQRNFARFVSEEHRDSQIWLEYNLVPIRWQLPVGVLFDMIVVDKSLPWQITVHFGDFPEKDLVPCYSKAVAEAHYTNCLKEADFLKTRKKVLNQMTQNEKRQMIGAIYSLQQDTFWAVNRKLMFTGEPWKHVPLRLYVAPENRCVQKLVGLANSDNEELTLDEVLRVWLPEVHEAVDKYHIWLHGVKPPLEAPLQWLAINMSYPDNFVHIVVTEK